MAATSDPIACHSPNTYSLASRFYPGCSPGQLIGPLDPSDFVCAKSIDSDRGSLFGALSADDLCRNYACCGLQLDDLHALVQHFEDVHVLVVDQLGRPAQPFHQPLPVYLPDPTPLPAYHGGFDPDDMELDVSPSPPDTPLTTPLSSHPPHSFNLPSPPPVSAFDTTTVPTRSLHAPIPPFPSARSNALPKTPEPFNGYARYSDYSSSMPGTVPSPPASDDAQSPVSPTEPNSPYGCLPPAVVFSTANTPANTPATSRVPSPSASSQPSASRASTTLSRPASSLLLSKPFRCPKPNCNKSYKQANGLKYHMTHGSCNFAPPKDLEQVQALLASKRSAREAAGEDENPITEGELREVEREAERRLRPFACGVGDCQRRYKNMNGLRYHYQHSGDHGAIGLALLASGQHDALQHAHGKTSAASSRQSTPLASGQTTPVTAHSPTYAQQYQQQMMYTSAQYIRAQQAMMHVQMASYPAIDASYPQQ